MQGPETVEDRYRWAKADQDIQRDASAKMGLRESLLEEKGQKPPKKFELHTFVPVNRQQAQPRPVWELSHFNTIPHEALSEPVDESIIEPDVIELPINSLYPQKRKIHRGGRRRK